MLHAVEHGKLTKGRTITPELVSVDSFWDVVLTQEADEEGLGRLSIAVALKNNVQHDAMFIGRRHNQWVMPPTSTCISSRYYREPRRVS